MPSFKSTAALAAMLGLAAASPIEKRGTFSLKQVQKGTYYKNGPAQLLKTFNKYGKVAPSQVVAAAASQTGSAAAEPGDEYDSLYLTPVTVGDKELELDVDTGSADLWVFSTSLSASTQSGHAVYDPSVSGTELEGSTWSITYGDGSGASGTVYVDKVVVGGVTATSQAVEAATSVSSSFASDTDNDGLLGLAFSSINTVKPKSQTTFFDTVADDLAEKLFAVTLRKGEAGEYDFGFTDESKYTGDIVYVDVDDSNGFWEFTPDGYSIGNGTVVSSTTIDAIADTGTTLLLLPDDVVTAYYDQVKDSQYQPILGGYIFPCGTELPDFTLVIGGEERTVPGSYIEYSPAIATLCFGGIQSDSGIGFSIVGDIFLKSQYVVFDQTTSTPRLGFAQQA
ncbi:putative aspartic endopeptidase pep1 protein [Botryosphaeria dothidea]|uniref:Aspartic endopeptidase pep1 protein n=1 Tax=Botryosphaeria dothidea TaxID=55169 RepID=A0A8H4N788_9PEZI|nr:putative aspartic endopeptidase pep1 protein [Botryosphaeria dothidea]